MITALPGTLPRDPEHRHNDFMTATPAITIVGLGPGDAGMLTLEARDVLSSAEEVWLRTSRHPAVERLPSGPRYESFDRLYESSDSFSDVYSEIVDRLLQLAARPRGVIYAVPGHPLVGEATARGLLEAAPRRGHVVRLVAGMSFVDVVAAELGIDPLHEGLLVIDALSLDDATGVLLPERPALIAQVYDQRAASQTKLALLELYPPDHLIRTVRGAGTPAARVTEMPLHEFDRDGRAFDHLTSLFVPALSLVEDVRTFAGLRRVIAKLRSPEGGCPWDVEQTHQTLKRFLLEEAYEALDALDEGTPHRIAEELGDLLMQVVLHAQVAEDNGDFAMEAIFASITAKLIRRHPHVFGDVQVSGADDVLRNWDALKEGEREGKPLLDAVPQAMPALAQAQSVQSRASKIIATPAASPVAELRALLPLLDSGEPDSTWLGQLLFVIVALARERGLDAEESLRVAIRRFRKEVSAAEAEATRNVTSGSSGPAGR